MDYIHLAACYRSHCITDYCNGRAELQEYCNSRQITDDITTDWGQASSIISLPILIFIADTTLAAAW